MPYFDINIFGTAHQQEDPLLFTFNLHVLQIETDLSTPTNFDLFLEFFAFPFNLSNYNLSTPGFSQRGTSIIAYYNDPSNQTNPKPPLTNRRNFNKPHIVHIDSLTATTSVDLYQCDLSVWNVDPSVCNSNQLAIANSLPSPCPNPQDMRLYSGTFCVPYGTNGFDTQWTTLTNPLTNSSNLSSIGRYFELPVLITINSDGCLYQKKGTINIYNNYTYSYLQSDSPKNPFGNVDCQNNQRFLEIGYFDKIRVT